MPKESVIKSLLSLQQAVEKTGIGYDTLLTAVKSGQLVAFRPGGRKYLIHKKDLKAYLDQFKPQPKPTTVPLFEEVHSSIVYKDLLELREQLDAIIRKVNI